MTDEIIIKPIGFIQSELKQRYETPRQGILAKGTNAVIQLYPKNNFNQALENLDGFDRLWIIYQFHLNKGWKPLVSPPRHTRTKVGVFSTRAPYRPNPIGLSCVKLEKVEGLKIFISGSDILNSSPILDIKPYLPYSDSFPGSSTGWVKNEMDNIYEILIEEKARKLSEQLKKEVDINLLGYARVQLEFNPTDITRKRISKIEKKDNSDKEYVLVYQKFKIIYRVNEIGKKVSIVDIRG
jgi:tRNA-Thr(GGU) m(6)t(6)A37 methyltransferase TsaA